MAFNPFFPATYQSPYGYNSYLPAQQQMMPQQTVQQQPMPQQNQQQMPVQPMNGGFVHVQSEQEARQYPVAPGNSVTFIDDMQAFCYTKTMGFNQFDAPQFKKFKLVEVVDQPAQNEQKTPSETQNEKEYNFEEYALKTDLNALCERIGQLEADLKAINAKSKVRTTKEADKNE